MTEELNNDPLENFFKKEFEGFEVEPGPEVWAKIDTNIPPKPRVAWWILLRRLLISLVLLIGFGAVILAVWQNQRARQFALELETQEAKIEALEQQLERMSEKVAKVEKAGEEANKTKSKAEEQVRDKYVEKTSQLNKRFEQKSIETSAVEPLQLLIQEKKLDDHVESRALKPSVHLSTNVDAGPLLALPGISPAFIPSDQQPESIIDLVKTEEKRTPGFYYGLYTEALFPGQSLEYRPQFAGQVKTGQLSWGVGLIAGLQFGQRMSIQSGLGFRWYNFHFQDAASLIYTFENTSVNLEGQIIGNYQIAQLGEISLESQVKNNVQNDGADIQEGAPFNLVFDLDYQLQYYSIPMQVTYTLGNRRLKTQLIGGLLFHTTLGEKLQEGFINFSFNRLSQSNLELEVMELKSNFLELGLGANLLYEWSPNISMGIGSSFYQALTPMVNNTHQTIGLNLNFNYRFTSKQNKR